MEWSLVSFLSPLLEVFFIYFKWLMEIKMNKFIVIAFFFLMGCNSPGTNYDVIIPDNIPTAWQQAMVQGCANWVDSLNTSTLPLQLHPVIGGTCTGAAYEICLHNSTEANNFSLAGSATLENTLALTQVDYKQHSDIYISEDIDAKENLTPFQQTQTMMHELGHAMGMFHTQPETLMCWAQTCALSTVEPDAVRPTCDDIAQWMSVRKQSDWNWIGCPYGGYFILEH